MKDQPKTDDVKHLLSYRKHLKKRKPEFVRQDTNHYSRLDTGKWRKSKGLHSKMRLRMRGYSESVTKGYKSPAAVSGMLSNGLWPIMVYNVEQISKLNPATQSAIIGSGVGIRKRIDMIKKAQELKIAIANIKDPAKYIKDVEDEKKAKAHDKKKKGAKKEEGKVKKEEKTIDALAEQTEEEKKGQHKKVQDKVLTSKDSGY